MIKDIIRKLTQHTDLTYEEAYEFVHLLKNEEISDCQIGGFLVALLMKGPTTEEIAAIAQAMRDACQQIRPKVEGRLIDTCGTGGGLNTYNVSTAVALVASTAGVPVAKHGSRSLSGLCGSADVLEKLGVEIDLCPGEAEALIEKIGIGFLYAPNFHPLMHRVLPPESELGIKTIFYTIIGPLINPADTRAHILGVYRPELVNQVAEVVARLKFEHAMVVHGQDGFDEISVVGPTTIAEVKDGAIKYYEIAPEDVGIKRHSYEDIKGGPPEVNARVLAELLAGNGSGAQKDFLLINSAAALLVGGKVTNLAEGVELAREVIDSGRAYAKLQQLIAESRAIKGSLPAAS